MTNNKSKSQKTNVDGHRYIDRISSLPVNVIECILNYMTTQDAARTSVLSTRWRYVWADHPTLVLGNSFMAHLQQSSRSTNELVVDYPNIVDKMLLHHVGYIRGLVIRVSSALSSMPHINIDSWISSLIRKGLKRLDLHINGSNPYKVPCFVFSTSELVELNLSFCIIRSGCFTNIQNLTLQNINFDSSVVLTTPLLTYLTLASCHGILHFDISAPRLETLSLFNNDNLNLKPFLTCTGIDYARFYSTGENAYFDGCESFCLAKLLAAWPGISDLVVDEFCFKHLASGSTPPKLDRLDLINFSIHDVYLDSEVMPWILWILKNSPLLQTFQITFNENVLNGGMTGNIIDESRCILDFRMAELHTVSMLGFTATSNELVLAKILLMCAPGLENMIVDEYEGRAPKENLRILKNLFSLQHVFPKARIIFRPNLIDL